MVGLVKPDGGDEGFVPPSPEEAVQIIANAFGQGFQAAFGPDYTDTNDSVQSWLSKNKRPDSDPPAPVDTMQCRIGASTFWIPPSQISVMQQFQTGSLTGAAIRQISSPKFNSGHSQTTINMTIYFPGVNNIWGYQSDSIDIDFMTAPDSVIDAYASSLRGFIAQFRYTPFVPIVNEYLNGVWNITSVGLQSLQIASVPGFPYMVEAQLTMVEFNHSIYMPMVNSLDDAIDWGRFRQFLGRAAVKLDAQANQAFATSSSSPTGGAVPDSIAANLDPNRGNAADALGNLTHLQSSFTSMLSDIGGASNIEFYYPSVDPAQIFGPTNFAFSSTQQGTSTNFKITDPSTWFNVIGFLGLGQGNNVTIGQAPTLDEIQQFLTDPTINQELYFVNLFFQTTSNIASAAADQGNTIFADSSKFEKFRDQEYQRMGINSSSAPEQKLVANQAIEGAWYTYIYQRYVTNNQALQQLFALQDFIRGTIEIDEWDVPMIPVNVPKDSIIVQNVAVNIGNNLARLQLSMVDRPAYQHIGGLDTVIQVDFVALGEAPLTALRNMFDTINNLSRLEHAHAVLGFLGIKNLMTALVGTRYVIPDSFEVDTIPGHPHVFQVSMKFLDFDVFQQKREALSGQQEADFIKYMSKRNPFLRLQQVWSALNTYSDFPLAITDEEGNIAGHLDPDFYFKQFATIDDDIVNEFNDPPKYGEFSKTSQNSDYHMLWHLGPIADDGSHQSIGLHGQGMDLREGNNIAYRMHGYNEAHAGNTHTSAFVKDDNQTATAPALYQTPNFDVDHANSNTGSSKGNFFSMLRDLQFRDISGRMIRAFPTYMLWLINENGNEYAGINLFSDFYGLQSVLDFSIVSNQDVMGETLQLRISNLYSRLSTAYQDLADPSIFPQVATLVNGVINTDRNLATGLNPNFMVNIETFNLRPGTRMHLRVGYGSDPNGLETVFNGVVTEVVQGEIMTIIAQSDAVELGALVNTSNPHGDSGSIDGSLTAGWYLSEPRDLIVRLLSMGESTFKQAINYATRGMLFSGNKFGIRHFGHILYDTMSDREKGLADTYNTTLNSINNDVQNYLGVNASAGGGGAGAGILNVGVGILSGQLWVNLNSQRDYEVFKRNVYPGNGTGIAQYMGGDIGDGGLNTAFQPPGVNADGQAFTPGPDPRQVITEAQNVILNPGKHDIAAPNNAANGDLVPLAGGAVKATTTVGEAITGTYSAVNPITRLYSSLHPIWKVLGIQPEVTDDVPGTKIPILGTYGPYAEISFRAETYQKTVWDLFRLCAKLLPNYIVAVRPFMERSTVFYGKPHWAYTSGVIPLTYGAELNGEPSPQMFDTSMQDTINQITNIMAQSKQTTSQDLYNKLNSLTPEQLASGNITQNSNTPQSVGGDPNSNQVQSVSSIEGLPLKHTVTGATIPVRSGNTCIEMHLPTNADYQTDVRQHQQLADLPGPERHPYYMDRGNGPENSDRPGKPGAFGYLDPADEQYYMNMRWDNNLVQPNHFDPSAYKGKKIMVFNPENLKGCVCTPGDYGPGVQDRVSGISPDTWWVLGQPDRSVLWYGFVADDVPLGPVAWVQGNTFQGQQLPIGQANTPAVGTQSGADASAQAGQAGSSDPSQTGGGTAASGTDPLAQLPPSQNVINQLAQQVYGNTRSTEDAKEIEAEFLGLNGHTSFINDDQTYKVFQSIYPSQTKQVYQQVANDFVNFIKNNPYCLGWLVLTADRATSLAQNIGGGVNLLLDPVGAIFGSASQGVLDDLGAPQWVKDVTNVITNPVGTAIGAATSLFHDVTGFFGDNPPPADTWDFQNMRDLFKVYLTEGPGSDPQGGQSSGAIEYMLTHNTPGTNSTNVIGRSIEGLSSSVFKDVTDFIGKVENVASAAFGAIESLVRWSITMFNQAVSLSGFAGKQANLLSGVFNDSYYYDPALGPGSILWQADNAYTREYGEPVVEVRQPFQRVHYINSFQHILSNNITEVLTGVPTVVTASANGKNPHTAYFDKGAPSQLQNEIAVDTGLYLDSPKWYSFFLHPSQVIRDFIKHVNNSDDATECSRIARWELANGLKNIYGGEVIILGDANIRTFDLLYLSDQYTKIYGLCQVEQVVHHFTPEQGFVTSITPGAITIVNDPERWEWGSIMQRQLAIQDIRNLVRQQTNVINNAETNSGFTSHRYDPNLLASSIETTLKGTVQYGGGPTSILKDFAGASALGSVAATAVLGPPGLLVGFLGWKAMSWIRDNLLDAHGAYIQYLNRNGSPMDAGLAYNQGVAVGQMHVWEGLSSALGISIPYDINGHAQITTTDLLSNIGWNESQTPALGTSIDMWNARTKAQLIQLSGKATEGDPQTQKVLAAVARVTDILDPITLQIQLLASDGVPGGYTKLQLAYLVKPSDISAKSASTLFNLNPTIAGTSAVNFLATALSGGALIGIRVNPTQVTVPGDSTTLLGTVFYHLPPGSPSPTSSGPDSLQNQLLNLAGKFPEIGWQEFEPDGTPYTLNWEMLVNGYATIDASILFRSGQGLESPALDISKFGFGG